jgi:hypothetical protein
VHVTSSDGHCSILQLIVSFGADVNLLNKASDADTYSFVCMVKVISGKDNIVNDPSEVRKKVIVVVQHNLESCTPGTKRSFSSLAAFDT